MVEKKVLLGMHDAVTLQALSSIVARMGAQVTTAQNLEGMLQAMGLQPDNIPKALIKNPFTTYLMDLNLGSPGTADYNPALRIYNLVRPYVESGEARFLGISGRPRTVELAKEAGIPAKLSTTENIDEFLGLQ